MGSALKSRKVMATVGIDQLSPQITIRFAIARPPGSLGVVSGYLLLRNRNTTKHRDLCHSMRRHFFLVAVAAFWVLLP